MIGPKKKPVVDQWTEVKEAAKRTTYAKSTIDMKPPKTINMFFILLLLLFSAFLYFFPY